VLNTHAEFAAFVTKRGRYPITSASELIEMAGKKGRQTVTYMGHKIPLKSLNGLPKNFFPVENEAALLQRMNNGDTYLREMGVLKQA
jgi:hypothetical protein